MPIPKFIHSHHAVLILMVTLVAVAFVAGCNSTPRGAAGGADFDPPDYEQLAQSHNERIEMLKSLYSRGVLEVRWRDEDGVRRREPQVDLDLYFMPDHRTAFRASKVGDIYLWLGSDDDRFWIFDMTGDDRVLVHGEHREARDHRGDMATLHPLLIRDLMGLAPLPLPVDGQHRPIEYHTDRDAWLVTLPATPQGWWIRFHFDRSSGLPTRAEAIGQGRNGPMIFISEIGRYRPAPQHGMAATRFPQMPTLVDITSDDVAEGVSRIEVKIALDSPTGRVDDQPMDRVFDLERLMQSLRPDRVERW